MTRTLARVRGSWLLAASLLILLCGFLFFHRLAERDLWSSHEGRAAQDAQSILTDGRWGVPQLVDRRLDLQKPPLYYWAVAGLSLLRGVPVDAWSVRLPAALSACGCVATLCSFGVLRGRPWAGLLSATMLATMMHFTALARTGRIDMPLTLAVTLTLLGCFQAQQGNRWWFLLAYVSVAAAVLLKGPIGVVLPVSVAAVHLFVERRLLLPRSPLCACRSTLWWGVPLVLALTVPWFWWANRHTEGELFRVFFWYHNVERAVGGGGLRTHEWWFYAPRLLIDLLPWSLLLPWALWHLCRNGRWRAEPEARFGLIWLATVTAVLSCAHFKRSDYLLPAFPGAALLIGFAVQRPRSQALPGNALPARLCLAEAPVAGCHLDANLGPEEMHDAAPRTEARRSLAGSAFPGRAWERGVTCFLFLVSFYAAGWWIYIAHILPREEPLRESRSFAAAVRRIVPPPQLVIFFRVEAHALAFHTGPQIDTILEWENIDTWAGRPGHHYIVMPPECAADWRQYVHSGTLEEVLHSRDVSAEQRPLVLMRTTPLQAASRQSLSAVRSQAEPGNE